MEGLFKDGSISTRLQNHIFVLLNTCIIHSDVKQTKLFSFTEEKDKSSGDQEVKVKEEKVEEDEGKVSRLIYPQVDSCTLIIETSRICSNQLYRSNSNKNN